MTRKSLGSGAALAALLLLLPLLAACRTAPPETPRARPGAAPAAPADGAAAGSRLAFRQLGRGLPVHSQWRDGFDVADLDGDGPLDLVSGPPRKGARRPGLFLGDGLGAFRFWSEAEFPRLDLDYGAAAAGDWNGDGKTDVAFAVHLRGFVALVQQEAGRFAPFTAGLALRPANLPSPGPAFSSRTLKAVDWDGDGRTDLVALAEGPGRFEPASRSPDLRGFRVFLNRGGRWETVTPPVPEEEFGVGLAVGDLDGDGHPDAVVASSVPGSKRILRHGLGTSWMAAEIEALRPDVYVTAVAIARLDNDALPDVAVAWLSPEGNAWRHGVDVLFSRPDLRGGFESRELWSEPGRARVTALDAGDVDGDAFSDLVSLDDAGTLRVFRREPPGFFALAATIPAPASRAGCGGTFVLARDVDRDGKDDVVASFAGEKGSGSGADAPCPTGGAIEVWSSVPR